MKNLKKSFFLFFSLLAVYTINAQVSGTISYTQTIQLDIKLPDGMELDGFDQAISIDKELSFKDQLSVYKDVKNNESNDQTMTSDDGSFQMTIGMDDSEEIFHTDFSNKQVVHQTGFMGKDFIIESDLEKHKWKLTGEKIKYLDFVCQKAEMVIEEEGKDVNIVAWFTSEIPVPIGPDSYNQLPGAILMISKNDGKLEIKATQVEMNDPATELFELPKKGKNVTQEEYDQIVEEKTEEMKKMFGDKKTTVIRG